MSGQFSDHEDKEVVNNPPVISNNKSNDYKMIGAALKKPEAAPFSA